ncbi:ABC transporter ATP-binding protein [Tenacibaculum tangerinum]|uniref:ABC transporter ATP-binding protein n=1 Tax=Tenacibaculum tangerinum TaxID=3038772 RepID=A0ABY8L3D5_9FLAO|nr:ABC transporter ATP-binding protein [Tenacibaculum tangerinum]WGH74868.1 ABC transporter ATP-binding protein [Tenacibaculum tangerinum]
MIEISNIYKKFGKVQVLNKLDLTIKNKGIFAILGPNGSGKTTLIKSILGMVLVDKGEIKINGKSVLHQFEYKKEISYLPQIANFPTNNTVSELIKLIKSLRTKETREEELIEKFGLEAFLDKKLGNLSGGTKQKVNIVLAFMFDNDLIILDEPTTGLDPISLITLKKIIQEEKKQGKTILITSHIMSFVEEMADEIVFLLDGEIYFKGTKEQLYSKTNKQDLEQAIANLLIEHHD